MPQRQLRDMISSPKALAEGLTNNGMCHRKYKMYTSMEKVLAILCTGYMYVANGKYWNDTKDCDQMSEKNAFARCFSYSATENMAMWMLYGGERGKNGAMIDIPQKVMKHITETEQIELGVFNEDGRFRTHSVIGKENYRIYLSDIIYTDKVPEKDKVVLTLADQHITTDSGILDESHVFSKHYAWSYEKECRLVIELSDAQKLNAYKNNLNSIRLKLKSKDINELKDSVYRSPIYQGKIDFGSDSCLKDTVKWNI